MKINPEATVFQRLCVVIGSVMAAVGFVVVTFMGFFSARENGVAIFVGLGLLAGGLLLARVKALSDAFLG